MKQRIPDFRNEVRDLFCVLICHFWYSMSVMGSPVRGSPSSVSLPLLRDVPVFMPVLFEIQEGDACMVIFADRDIDAWFETGEAEVPPSGRMHSLSDGFAFVGFRPRVIPSEVEGSSL